MKTFTLSVFALAFAFQAQASDNYRIELDWNKKSTLQDNIVQQCDDSFIPAVEIVIPGRAGTDFSVEMVADITTGKADLGCTFKKKVVGNTTVYTFVADSYCEITVRQNTRGRPEVPKTAHYEISDAC